MGELSRSGAHGAGGRKGWSWLAAIPFAIAWTFAAATLNAALAPTILHAPGLEEAPLPASAPAPPPPPAHDVVFESTELISV